MSAQPVRLVQLRHGSTRRVARVDEPSLRLLADTDSIFALANDAIREGVSIRTLVARRATPDEIDYDSVYAGSSSWRLLVPIDHPEPARCLVSGTGLTHLGSAASRNAMHSDTSGTERGERGPQRGSRVGVPEGVPASGASMPGGRGPRIKDASGTERGKGVPASGASMPGGRGPRIKEDLTDSMRMFRTGLDGGRPEPGRCGAAPEWFYKGNGTVLRASGEELLIPGYAEDGGEEAEVAGIYLVDAEGRPRRIGMAAGNEFSDHRFEKQNYLHLAGSKLRNCSLGPEVVIEPDFARVAGRVGIERRSRTIWEREIATGEREMCHSVANLEHHHFKFEAHRRPGDVHVHYYGAHSLSFADGVTLEDGDVMTIQFEGFGRPLRNVVRVAAPVHQPITVTSIA